MTGFFILLLLILISALPILGVFIWFRVIRLPLELRWIFGSILGGAAALLIAGMLQSLFPPAGGARGGSVFVRLFIHIALIEEGAKLIVLGILLKLRGVLDPRAPLSRAALGAALGLLVGLGFAFIENASYGATDMGLAVIRALTAAPIHGACGSRVGVSAVTLRDRPLAALFRFCAAAAIHGTYNLMLLLPGFSALLVILIALSSLLSSMLLIRQEVKGPD